jgi:hypothetical protein
MIEKPFGRLERPSRDWQILNFGQAATVHPDGESVEGSAVHAMPKRRNVNLIPTHKRGFNAAKPKNGQIGCHGSRPCMISRSEEMKF